MIKLMVKCSVLLSSIRIGDISIRVKNLSLFYINILIIILLIYFMIVKNEGKIRINYYVMKKYSLQFFAIWLIYAIVSIGWVKDYALWFRACCFLALANICIIIICMFFRTSDDILTAFRLMTIMTMMHNIVGWYEVFTGNYLFLPINRIATYSTEKYPVSMFYNTNDYATFMLFSIFFAYICAVNSGNRFNKLLYGGTILSSITLLVMTSSRANIAGLIMAIFGLIYFSLKNRKWIIPLFLFLTLLFIPDSMSNIILTIKSHLDFSQNTGSNFVRLNLIKNGFCFLLSTYGFGTGAGNIEYWMNNYAVFDTGGILNMHNWWMEILAGYGIIVFSLYILFYCKLFRDMYRVYRTFENKKDKSISLGVMCIMVGYIIGSISSSSNISAEWLWVFWGISIAFQGICSKKMKNKYVVIN